MKRVLILPLVLWGLLGCQSEKPVAVEELGKTRDTAVSIRRFTPDHLPPLCDPPVTNTYRLESSAVYSVIGGSGSTIDLHACQNDSLGWVSAFDDTSDACAIMSWVWDWIDSSYIHPVWRDICNLHPHIDKTCWYVVGNDTIYIVPPTFDTACPSGIGATYYRVVSTHEVDCARVTISWWIGSTFQGYRRFSPVPDSLSAIRSWLRETVACGIWNDIRDYSGVENCDCPGQ